MIEIKSSGSLKRDETLDLKSIIGRKVLTKKGEKIGKIQAVHINPSDFKLEGITVDKPGLVENDYIGRNYIQAINQEGAFLKITPLSEYLDKKVFDARGRKIGKVKEIKRSRKTNKIITLVVGRGLLKGDLIVPSKMIGSINDAIVLKYNIPN